MPATHYLSTSLYCKTLLITPIHFISAFLYNTVFVAVVVCPCLCCVLFSFVFTFSDILASLNHPHHSDHTSHLTKTHSPTNAFNITSSLTTLPMCSPVVPGQWDKLQTDVRKYTGTAGRRHLIEKVYKRSVTASRRVQYQRAEHIATPSLTALPRGTSSPAGHFVQWWPAK